MAEYKRDCQGPGCTESFTTKRQDTDYCSPRCRRRASRQPGYTPKRQRNTVPPAPPPPPTVLVPAPAKDEPDEPDEEPEPPAEPELVVAVREALDAAGQLTSWEGRMAVSAAWKLAGANTTAAATASLMKELTALMTKLTKDATPAADTRRTGVRGKWRAKAEAHGAA